VGRVIVPFVTVDYYGLIPLKSRAYLAYLAYLAVFFRHEGAGRGLISLFTHKVHCFFVPFCAFLFIFYFRAFSSAKDGVTGACYGPCLPVAYRARGKRSLRQTLRPVFQGENGRFHN
jgi:hypothetical protein